MYWYSMTEKLSIQHAGLFKQIKNNAKSTCKAY